MTLKIDLTIKDKLTHDKQCLSHKLSPENILQWLIHPPDVKNIGQTCPVSTRHTMELK